MWKIISLILRKADIGGNGVASEPTTQNLLDLFNNNIDSVRHTTGDAPMQSSLPPAFWTLSKYMHLMTRKIIRTVPSKSC